MEAKVLAELWSAAPTPLTAGLAVDTDAVARMVEAAVEEGLTGLFLAGTCGEGPWLPDRERRRLVVAAAAAGGGRLKLAAQVTDNSVPRVLENIERMAEAGAQLAVMAPPPVALNATPDRIVALFLEAAAASPLPVGVYDLGAHRAVSIPEDRLIEVYRQPQVVLVKDSSGSPARRERALAARSERPGLRLFNGDEFRCVEYLLAGYDGCLFGGAVAVAPQLGRIAALVAAGREAEARAEDAAMRGILHGLYGGPSIGCWLTGLKHHLVCRGMFGTAASFLGYPLTEECRRFGESLARASGRHGVATGHGAG